MSANVGTQALILAGGQATRMRPYTDDAPKAMVPVAGAPIVGYQLAWPAALSVTGSVMVGEGEDGCRAADSGAFLRDDECPAPFARLHHGPVRPLT